MEKRWAIGLGLFLGALFGAGAPGSASAQVTIDGAPDSTQIIVDGSGDTFVGVWVHAPDAPRRGDRPPMALSLVIDTSGSMSGEKIANARMAAQSVLETLQEGDIVSIYGFSDAVTEYASPTVIGRGSRQSLMAAVQGLEATGSTNLYDGLRAGIARVGQAPASHTARRVIVLSDGQANVGPSDPGSLGNVAAQGSEYGLQVTAIGVGLDYDERTLGAIAVRSSGRLYHLAQPSQMASILREEIGLLASTVASDVIIEITPSPGVVIIEGLTMGAEVQNGLLRLPVGSLYSGQERELLFKARVDTHQLGNRPLATARLVYRDATGAHASRSATAPIAYTVTNDRRAASTSRQPRVAAMVATYDASQAQMRAADALNRGDTQAATVQLARAEDELRTAAAAAPAAERRVLEERANRVGSIRSRAAGAASPAAARGAALESYDSAYDAAGY
ncbi:MAG: VWA domain-containing protein [Polyangiales bacterium]